MQAQLQEAKDKGLLEQVGGVIKPTLLGQRFLNTLLEMFLPE
jgi:coproporphyrinogen III oxidase-like Fe-S oxidoreductase